MNVTSYGIAMIRENHPSGASSKKDGLAAMDEHPALSRMFGNQSKSVSPRRVGHRVVRRDARPQFRLQPTVQLPPPVPARPPTLWQRLRLWLWPRLTPEQVYARFLRERRADLFPRTVIVGGHPVLLTAPEPTRSRTHRAQSDLP